MKKFNKITMKKIIIILVFPLFSFSQTKIGITIGSSSKKSYDFGITSQNLIKKIGFNVNYKGKSIYFFKNNSSYSDINYSLLAGINYNFKRLVFNTNAGYSNLKNNLFLGNNTGQLNEPNYKVICYEGLIGYNLIDKKNTLNVSLGYNNNYGAILNASFLFGK